MPAFLKCIVLQPPIDILLNLSFELKQLAVDNRGKISTQGLRQPFQRRLNGIRFLLDFVNNIW